MKKFSLLFLVAATLIAGRALAAETNVDLLKRYPTTLTAGDTTRVRPWDFAATDIFWISQFHFDVGTNLHVATGEADLGIGHCADGAVWAVVIPRKEGTATSKVVAEPETISHVWLRFHPKEMDHLFPPETVFADGTPTVAAQMRAIANVKMGSSWQGGGQALIPEPKDLIVDMDTQGGPRRFFTVDTASGKIEYVNAFERRSVKLPPPLTPELAAKAFDELWQAFDRDYAMFVLHPEVDWNALREQYRPLALKSSSTYELADICAEMLRPLRDLHVGLSVAGTDVSVFNRSRTLNANPDMESGDALAQHLLGDLRSAGHVVYVVTPDNVGYIMIPGWYDASVPAGAQKALEAMRNTRGLIVDVRLNGGGGEPWAEEFAGRFLKEPFVYAFSQYRNGPRHTNLTERFPRTAKPHGPWRYDRKVIVLIGQKCMSSTESFIGMMTGDPDAITMGDHTCGSSGNPKIVKLPLDLAVRLPQWIDYLPDGTPLDERGFQPQVPFKPGEGAFEGNRDDLLTAALERLKKEPLPKKAIEGPAFK